MRQSVGHVTKEPQYLLRSHCSNQRYCKGVNDERWKSHLLIFVLPPLLLLPTLLLHTNETFGILLR